MPSASEPRAHFMASVIPPIVGISKDRRSTTRSVRAFIADEGDDVANLDSMTGKVKDMLSFFNA